MASIKLFRIFDIDVKVHYSLFIIIAIFSYAFYVSPFAFSELKNPERSIFSILAAVGIFFSVLVHELSHSITAKRYGGNVREIILFIFGGMAVMDKMPKKEGVVSFAGPLASILLGAVFFAFYVSVPYPLSKFFLLMSEINFILAIFNLIPAFPLDGGRILRSILAKKYGFYQATRIAAELGKFLAIFMAIYGLFFNLWLLLIAIFIYMGANEEEKLVTIESLLSRFKVGDLMTREVVAVTPDMTVGDVLRLMFERKHLGYPVVKNGEVIGIVTLHDIVGKDENTKIEEVMTRNVITVTPDTPMIDALRILASSGVGRLVVVDNGKLVGILTRTDIVKAVEILEVYQFAK